MTGDEEPPPIDYGEFMGRIGSRRVHRRLLRLFIEHSPTALDGLLEAAADADDPRLCRAAHQLRGMANTISARPLADIAADIERAGRCGDRESVLDQIASLRDQHELTRREIRRYLDREEPRHDD